MKLAVSVFHASVHREFKGKGGKCRSRNTKGFYRQHHEKSEIMQNNVFSITPLQRKVWTVFVQNFNHFQ